MGQNVNMQKLKNKKSNKGEMIKTRYSLIFWLSLPVTHDF